MYGIQCRRRRTQVGINIKALVQECSGETRSAETASAEDSEILEAVESFAGDKARSLREHASKSRRLEAQEPQRNQDYLASNNLPEKAQVQSSENVGSMYAAKNTEKEIHHDNAELNFMAELSELRMRVMDIMMIINFRSLINQCF